MDLLGYPSLILFLKNILLKNLRRESITDCRYVNFELPIHANEINEFLK